MPRVEQKNKAIVQQFCDLAFTRRRPEQAAAEYLSKDYRQHSPLAVDGANAFVALVNRIADAHPDFRFEIKRVIAEGDLVVVHSHFVPLAGERGSAVVDIFRVDDARIVEHWDVMQEIPENTTNQNTMF